MATYSTSYTPTEVQRDIIGQRLPWVASFLIIISVFLVLSLARYQLLSPDVEREFVLRGEYNTQSVRRLPAERGVIYDRDGEPLAFNKIQYEIGVSPQLISDARLVANELSVILDIDALELYQVLSSDVPWSLIARPVSAEIGQQIADFKDEQSVIGIIINPLMGRLYPQNELAGPVIGFIIEDEDSTSGAVGVERSYNDQLAGQALNQQVSTIPFDLPTADETGQRGMSIVLTIDRDIQFWVEYELARAIEEYNATGGTIIVSDPRNGDILAMASNPSFDPNRFIEVDNPALLRNPAINESFEPGSVFKVLTMAAGLEKGIVTPQWTYNDQGSLEVGGITVRDWDRQAHGIVDATTALVQSLNIGMATIALELGPDDFYSSISAFGIGSPTRIDLPGEQAGILHVPGDPDWSESNLATNSFGQGVSVTAMQMLSAVNAIANDGLIMQPRVVRQLIDGSEVINAQTTSRRAISSATAHTVARYDGTGGQLARWRA